MINNKKLSNIVEYVKDAVKKIINFYYSPFSDIDLSNFGKAPKKKKREKPKKQTDEKIKSSGIITQIKEYYGRKIYISIFLSLISVFVALYVLLIFGISYLWLSAYIITFGVFLSFYSGIKAVFQRKRSIIDGYLRFIREFLIYRKDITLKTHILEAKEENYPYYFGKELRKMKLSLNTKQSYDVLSEFFEDPRNNYPELITLKNLSLSVISTKDDSIAKALSEQIEYIENSRTVLSSKLSFTKIFVFLAIGFIFLIQAFLVYQFSSTLGSSFSNNGEGFSLHVNLIPNPINYFLLLYIGGISLVLLMVAIDLGTYNEDKIANHVVFLLSILIVISAVLFFLHL